MFIVTVPMLGAMAAGGAGSPRAANATGAPAAPAPPAATPAADGDAAAKHARRTACLKEAKTKKLVGAPRAAFIKDCIAAH